MGDCGPIIAVRKSLQISSVLKSSLAGLDHLVGSSICTHVEAAVFSWRDKHTGESVHWTGNPPHVCLKPHQQTGVFSICFQMRKLMQHFADATRDFCYESKHRGGVGELKVGLQHLYTVEGKILVPVYTQYRLEKASGALH